jgi:DNA-directed RNA polymerase subunit RPC12/RpoP
MKLEVRCPSCQKEFRFTDQGNTKTVPCPHCGDEVSKDQAATIVEEAVQATKPTSRTKAGEGTQRCPQCGKIIPVQARKCKFCRTWIDEEEEEPIETEYAPCPRCGARQSRRVVFTFWGSFYGPALFTHVQCPKCHYKYNGKTGRSNLIPAILFVMVPLIGILVIIGGLVVLVIRLGKGP